MIPLHKPHARLTAELEAFLAAEYPQLKPLLTHLQALVAIPDPLSWMLDLSDWTSDRLARLI